MTILKPEIATSYEAGLDMKFFNNRLGLTSLTIIARLRTRVMKVPAAAPWSGGQWVNAGLITNQGVELMLYSTMWIPKTLRSIECEYCS